MASIKLWKRKKMFWAVFATSLACIFASVVIASIAVTYFTYHFMTEEKGQSRVEVLRQISDSNTVNRSNMVNVMNMVHEDYYDLVTATVNENTDRVIEQSIEETALLLERMGMNYTIDILMNDKRVFSTGSDEKNIKSLKSTYWYIRHYSGETDTSWNLRFLDADDLSSFGLSYGRTIYNADGRSIGVIVVTSAHEALFRTFQQIVRDGARVYILDRNGIIISHSNTQRVGNWMADMESFAEEYPQNSFRMIRRGEENVMISNYHDPDSGWTFVEEQSMDSLLRDSFLMLRQCLLAVLLGCLLASWVAYIRVRRVTDVFANFSEQIGNMPAEQLTVLPVRDEYEETYVLSTTFNGMILRIQDLICDIRQREREKQRTEYDFLHAQVNPHFLSNTLLAVKSLLAMGEVGRASRMMSELVDLLHIPSSPEIQFVPLEEELHLVRNYISIMNCRTEKGVRFICDIPPGMRENPVPRMILQPIIGNSFFHGFAERDEGCEIYITAGYRGRAMYIEVTDNGEGIAPARLRQVSSWEYTSEETHHGIGLKNIRRRLQIIYGGRSGVHIRSTQGVSTTITVQMDHYQAIRNDNRKGGWEE